MTLGANHVVKELLEPHLLDCSTFMKLKCLESNVCLNEKGERNNF